VARRRAPTPKTRNEAKAIRTNSKFEGTERRVRGEPEESITERVIRVTRCLSGKKGDERKHSIHVSHPKEINPSKGPKPVRELRGRCMCDMFVETNANRI
jgi:hypothetical protein